MLELRTECLKFFDKIFNNIPAMGPELTKNKRNLTIFRSYRNNSKQTFSVSDWKFANVKFYHKTLKLFSISSFNFASNCKTDF